MIYGRAVCPRRFDSETVKKKNNKNTRARARVSIPKVDRQMFTYYIGTSTYYRNAYNTCVARIIYYIKKKNNIKTRFRNITR